MLPTTDHVIDGVRCAVYDSDPGRREAVVFVHCNPGPMDDWEDLIPAVTPFARAVALGMPGYGRAERPRQFDYTIDGYARHLGRLLDQLPVGRAHLVLHDFGGPCGLRWAMGNPGRVGSVTLINGTPPRCHAASSEGFDACGAGMRSHHSCAQDRQRYLVSTALPSPGFPSTVRLARNK